MEVVNYDNLVNQIKKLYQNKVYIEQIVTDDNTKRKLLEPILKKEVTSSIDSFKQILFEGLTILEYETVDYNTNKRFLNIILIKGSKIIFQLKYHLNKNYSEATYSTFDDESSHLTDKLYLKSYRVNNVEHLMVSILGKCSNDDTYFQKNYSLYIDNDKVTAIEINNSMYLENEVGFDNIISTFQNLINKTSKNISRKIDSLICDDVKEYHILRKKQEQ